MKPFATPFARLFNRYLNPSKQVDLLKPIRRRVLALRVETPDRARKVAQLIPAQCPFERDIFLFGRLVAHFPPLCKLNPLYNELVELRFRALCYLADECGEDISAYI
jgi:hypothetical protein